MRRFLDSSGELLLASIDGAVFVGRILGIWPLIGVIAAGGTSLYIASLFDRRR